MKNILSHILVLFFLAACSPNQQENFESGILWKIESKSGIESFIFGTIHLYPKAKMDIPDKAVASLQKCNVLALETAIPNQIDRQKFAEFEMPGYLLKSFGIIVAEYGEGLENMEMVLMDKALEANLTVTGLDSTDEVLERLKTLRDVELEENTFIEENMLTDYKQNLELYQEESIDQFYKKMEIQMGKEITEILVDDRNEYWIEKIESLIQKDRTFIAVGVGHLGGKNGILNLLDRKGYQIKKVE